MCNPGFDFERKNKLCAWVTWNGSYEIRRQKKKDKGREKERRKFKKKKTIGLVNCSKRTPVCLNNSFL